MPCQPTSRPRSDVLANREAAGTSSRRLRRARNNISTAEKVGRVVLGVAAMAARVVPIQAGQRGRGAPVERSLLAVRMEVATEWRSAPFR